MPTAVITVSPAASASPRRQIEIQPFSGCSLAPGVPRRHHQRFIECMMSIRLLRPDAADDRPVAPAVVHASQRHARVGESSRARRIASSRRWLRPHRDRWVLRATPKAARTSVVVHEQRKKRASSQIGPGASPRRPPARSLRGPLRSTLRLRAHSLELVRTAASCRRFESTEYLLARPRDMEVPPSAGRPRMATRPCPARRFPDRSPCRGPRLERECLAGAANLPRRAAYRRAARRAPLPGAR